MSKSLHLLLVEDCEDDALILLHELRKGGYDLAYERVDTAAGMNAALDKHKWDIVIADYVLPNFSAPDALKLLKDRGIDFPFIVVSGKIGEDTAVEAMKAGAHDYIMKNNLKRLVAAVERELREADVRRERRHADEVIRRRLEFEKTVSAISSRFVGVFDIDDAINASLADMGRFSKAGRAYIFLMGEDGVTMDNTHEWCAESVNPQMENLKNLPLVNFPWWMEKLRKGEVIQIEDISRMPSGAKAEKEILEKQQIRSLLALPLVVSGELAGFVGFDNVVGTGTWNADDLALLKVCSEIIGNALERKKAEEALKQSEHSYRVLFESTLDGLIVMDIETMKVVFGNQTAAKLYGYESVEEALGVDPTDFIHSDDKERALKVIKDDLFEKGLRQVNEFRTITRDGRETWISAIGTRTEYQGRSAVLVSIRDITEQKKMEEEKQRLEAQLHLSGRLAAIGELSAGVAHEINNPLAAIKGFSELLLARYDLDEAVKGDVEAIFKEAQRATRITRNLLSFAHRHEPEKSFISINEALAQSLDLCAYHMKVNNIDMAVEFDPELPGTMADLLQMQQVFVNIIVNAEQAMVEAHGKGRLIVKTQKTDGFIRVSFIDNGPGIPEGNLTRIFDPFFTTKEVGKGTGLGLSICYGLVEAHGGRIYARSKAGQGATFVVEIPIISEH
jgi:two-component system NtrC family sensor kinase